MERLTVNNFDRVCQNSWISGLERFCTQKSHEESGCRNGCHILKEDVVSDVEVKIQQVEQYRIAAAKYKAYFFHKTDLAEKLEKQSRENLDALVGEFDGMTYASWRARAVYRTLEDMRDDGFITSEEYAFCITL